MLSDLFSFSKPSVGCLGFAYQYYYLEDSLGRLEHKK